MDAEEQVAGVGEGRLGRVWAGLPRPGGVRNGGLLLLLVGLAAVMALVDRPPEPVAGGLGNGIFQHLPPPAGITQLPPAPPGALGDGERPYASGRGHPRRAHPRPDRSGSSRLLRGDLVTAPGGGDQPGSGGGSGSGGSGPPVAAPSPPVAAVPATRVGVAPVAVRVTPPPVLGRDLPAVGVETPAVGVQTPAVRMQRSAVEAPRLRLG
jgi:hypothetical protein